MGAQLGDAFWLSKHFQDVLVRGVADPLALDPLGPRQLPAPGDLFVRPRGGNVRPRAGNEVLVIGKNRIVPNIHGEHGGLVLEQRLDPGPTMLEVLSGDGVLATQEGALHAA
jgi:hypothetical protein